MVEKVTARLEMRIAGAGGERAAAAAVAGKVNKVRMNRGYSYNALVHVVQSYILVFFVPHTSPPNLTAPAPASCLFRVFPLSRGRPQGRALHYT